MFELVHQFNDRQQTVADPQAADLVIESCILRVLVRLAVLADVAANVAQIGVQPHQ